MIDCHRQFVVVQILKDYRGITLDVLIDEKFLPAMANGEGNAITSTFFSNLEIHGPFRSMPDRSDEGAFTTCRPAGSLREDPRDFLHICNKT